MRPRARGFTLLEVLLALSIMAGVLTLAFGALRIGVNAWRQGEQRAERQDRARNLQLVLTRALAGTHAYRAALKVDEEPALLFRGEETEISFVTVTPPLDHRVPVAFTAVTISLAPDGQRGLAIWQKALPNLDPFEKEDPVLTEPAIAAARFRYLREVDGAWVDVWDPVVDGPMPRAVEITLTTAVDGMPVEHWPFTVPIRVEAAA